jgi:diguanylate cyclase (GGDEF)-like protein
LGEGGHISDFNTSANRWFSSIGIDLRTTTLEGVLYTLTEKGAIVTKSPEGQEGRDIFFTNDGFPLILNLRTHDMIDEKRYKQGFIAFFSDVTQNRMLLDKLEKRAGVDSLTDLPNRVAYDGAKARFDDAEHLPLSVIMCDLNDLKETNDNLGHRYGDMMLQTASEILDNACAKQNFVARIGGDEFIILLSRTDEKRAADLIKQIKKTVLNYKNLPFKLSLAMGAATKHNESESLDDVIALADKLMYQDKKYMKEAGALWHMTE